jgi:hypothetical protein
VFEAMIAEMQASFRKGVFKEKTTFAFIVNNATITITLDAESFTAREGSASGKVDCTCKTSEEMFRKIWFDGYRPGIMDFMGGAIKADAPLLLPQFLKAFGKM